MAVAAPKPAAHSAAADAADGPVSEETINRLAKAMMENLFSANPNIAHALRNAGGSHPPA